VPDPLAPPLVGTTLGVDEATAVHLAVAAAEAGDFMGAERHLKAAPPAHPARVLAALEIDFLQGAKVEAEALALAKREGGYGSAWGFAAIAANREADPRSALDAARRAAELQPDAGWDKLIGEVAASLSAGLLAQGTALLARGDASGALDRAREALAVVPEAVGARMLAVRALLTLRDTRGAAALVPGLPDSAEGLTLKGKVAEALGQWDLALDLYGRLPGSDPNRCELIETARAKWRLANAPPYVVRALENKSIHRRDLAAILVFEVPALAELASASVPVFEDVVQVPEHLDILTVARAGVISGDPLTRRFGPDHTVSARELEATLDRLAKVLHHPAPRWCDSSDVECLKLPASIDGETAVALVRQVAGGGGEPCAQR
jgi:tetratricopeptide (TPR) repeat protein